VQDRFFRSNFEDLVGSGLGALTSAYRETKKQSPVWNPTNHGPTDKQ
jgi:hypothetical protein